MSAETKSGYAKPLPTKTREGAPFWEATRRRELQVQYCPDCEKHQFPPRRLCVHCGGRKVTWRKVSGAGKIYSFTVIHRAPEPSFTPDVPYVLAVVDLAEGGRMMTNIIDCPVNDVRVDMPVSAAFEQVSDDVTLVKFRPSAAGKR